MKKILVIVDQTPFNTIRASEAFRMCMGLTVSDNEISLLLINDGAYNLMPLHAEKIGRPAIDEYVDHFEKVNLHYFVDADSLLERDISPNNTQAKQLPHVETLQLINDADVVIPFR